MIPSKSLIAYILMMTCLEVKLQAQSIAPVEITHSNQENAKLLIGQLDEALTEIVERFPNNIDNEEFDQIIENSFEKFYLYITATKPKAQSHALIMYLQYAEMIFKHGTTSQKLRIKDEETRKNLFYYFITTWENMLEESLESQEESLYNVIVDQKN